jgi:uncharacterized protein (DUF1501 family)
MLRIDTGACCTGMSRRSFLQLGAAGLTTLGLPQLLRARHAAAAEGPAKDTRVILLWLEGGPSHMDLWDMKPHAPAEYRGFWRPIATAADGIEISEMFPKQARVADKFSILRSLHHGDGDHPGSEHILLTGRPGVTVSDPAPKSPSIGSVVARAAGPRRPGLPAYVVTPEAVSGLLRPGYYGAHYVGRAYDPFETGGDPNSPAFKIQNLVLPGGMSVERLEDRRQLRKSLDALRRDVETSGNFEAMDRFEQQAYELVTGPAVSRAFNIGAEDPGLRDRYGRNSWGQGVLLARRLAEAGVTFTTVKMGGWDQHGDLKARMLDYLPKVDAAVSSLFEDLSSRGLLEKVLVVVGGEMSRMPKMNDGFGGLPAGRDHWSSAISFVLGGGGVKGGRVVGKTDPRGEYVVERPVSVQDLHATIYHALGIDPYLSFLNTGGRPVPAVDDGTPIRELF